MDSWGDNIFDELIVTPPGSPRQSANEGRTLEGYRQSSSSRNAVGAPPPPSPLPKLPLGEYEESARAGSSAAAERAQATVALRDKSGKTRSFSKCDECGKVMRVDNLKVHMSVCHTEPMNWPCGNCSARFSTSRARVSHWKECHGLKKPAKGGPAAGPSK